MLVGHSCAPVMAVPGDRVMTHEEALHIAGGTVIDPASGSTPGATSGSTPAGSARWGRPSHPRCRHPRRHRPARRARARGSPCPRLSRGRGPLCRGRSDLFGTGRDDRGGWRLGRRQHVRRVPQAGRRAIRGRVLAFLNISAMGQVDPHLGELHDLRFADPERLRRGRGKSRPDRRLQGPRFGDAGRAEWDRGAGARARGGPATGLPVMVHIGGTLFGLEEVLDRLRPGDVVTHSFTGWQPGGPRRRRAGRGRRPKGSRARGALRRRPWRRELHVAGRRGRARRRLPTGLISTDLHRFNVASPVHDLVIQFRSSSCSGCPSRRSSRWSPRPRRSRSG